MQKAIYIDTTDNMGKINGTLALNLALQEGFRVLNTLSNDSIIIVEKLDTPDGQLTKTTVVEKVGE